MVQENVLTLNEAQIVYYNLEEFLFAELNLALRHLVVLAYRPNKLRRVLQSDQNFPHRTVRRPQLLGLQRYVRIIQIERISGVRSKCLGGLKRQLDGVLGLELLRKCIRQGYLYVVSYHKLQ